MRRLAHALTWLLLERTSVRRSIVLGATIAFFSISILFFASTIDENFWLPDRGVGLFQHPGIPVILLSDFFVLFFSASVARAFLMLAKRLPTNGEPSTRRYLRRIVSRGRSSILLGRPALQLFLLSAGIGLIFWTLNATQTLNPIKYYGNDVFDSYSHKASYIALRIVLGISWVLLYPYCAVAIFSVAGNIFVATRLLRRRNRLAYKTFHPDRSGGFSYVGNINFSVIMAMVTLYCALLSVIHTHHKLNILQVSGLIILSAAFIVASYLISSPTIGFLIEKRRAMLLSGYRAANNSSKFIPTLTWLVTAESFSPYSTLQRVSINVTRIMSVALTAQRLWALI
jgi:hypothetical protein